MFCFNVFSFFQKFKGRVYSILSMIEKEEFTSDRFVRYKSPWRFSNVYNEVRAFRSRDHFFLFVTDKSMSRYHACCHAVAKTF